MEKRWIKSAAINGIGYILFDYTEFSLNDFKKETLGASKHICLDKQPTLESITTILYISLHQKMPDDTKRYVYLDDQVTEVHIYLLNEEQHNLHNPVNICDVGV